MQRGRGEKKKRGYDPGWNLSHNLRVSGLFQTDSLTGHGSAFVNPGGCVTVADLDVDFHFYLFHCVLD